MPFGCSEEQIEQALFKFVVDLLSPQSMHHIRKLYFVPVGLPGMGKSTLAKNIRLSVQNNLSFNQQNHGKKTRQAPQLGQASNLTSLAQKAEITDPSSLNGASA